MGSRCTLCGWFTVEVSTPVPQVSWDNRPAIAKRRRAELYGFLNHLNIPHPVGAPKSQMLDLLSANGIDLNAPHQYFEWQVINGMDELGNQHQHVEPVTPVHESARLVAEGKPINYDQIIAQRAAEVAEKDDQLGAQDTVLETLMARLEVLETNSLPLTSMSPPQLKGIAKRRGLDIAGLKSKDELITLLEG
jgi:hypothetical protein